MGTPALEIEIKLDTRRNFNWYPTEDELLQHPSFAFHPKKAVDKNPLKNLDSADTRGRAALSSDQIHHTPSSKITPILFLSRHLALFLLIDIRQQFLGFDPTPATRLYFVIR
jgi:hypothetical protein